MRPPSRFTSSRMVFPAHVAALLAALTLGGPLLLGATSEALADERTLRRAEADAFVRADRGGRGYGRMRTLRLGSRPLRRTYLRFPLTGIARPIRRAALLVWARNGASGGFIVRLASSGWRERALTFARAPRPVRRAIASGPVKRGWTIVDVSPLVHGVGSSVTFVLSSSSRGGIALASREDRARAPRLRLTRRPADTVVLAGAGDIAYEGPKDAQTAALLDGIDPDIVYTLGDNAYDDGTAEEFRELYAPTWGRHKARTRPSAGNHEYHTPGAAGYFAYFGAKAGDPATGYYSYDTGSWHVVVLNTNGEGACARISCNRGSAQERWLRADLLASQKQCTLAYWHHPRYSIGPQGTHSGTQGLWDALADDGAELVLAAHDHNYQRWRPMNAVGAVDDARGIRSFVVGTGGETDDELTRSNPNVEAASEDTPGVLKLTLRRNSYEWEFVPITGKTFRDFGSGTCH